MYYFTFEDSLWYKLITYNIERTFAVHQDIAEIMQHGFEQNNFGSVSHTRCNKYNNNNNNSTTVVVFNIVQM